MWPGRACPQVAETEGVVLGGLLCGFRKGLFRSLSGAKGSFKFFPFHLRGGRADSSVASTRVSVAWTLWQPTGDSFYCLIMSLGISVLGFLLGQGSRWLVPCSCPTSFCRAGPCSWTIPVCGAVAFSSACRHHRPQSELVQVKKIHLI